MGRHLRDVHGPVRRPVAGGHRHPAGLRHGPATAVDTAFRRGSSCRPGARRGARRGDGPAARGGPGRGGGMRIGLLGTGPWARAAHAPALDAHPGLDFVGVWGRRPEAAGELAAVHGVRAYDDVDALLADVDAVAAALPLYRTGGAGGAAARAGRHLLLDKPLATTVAQGARSWRPSTRRAWRPWSSSPPASSRSRRPGSRNRRAWAAGSPGGRSGSARCSPPRTTLRRLALAAGEGRPVGRRPARPVRAAAGAGRAAPGDGGGVRAR